MFHRVSHGSLAMESRSRPLRVLSMVPIIADVMVRRHDQNRGLKTSALHREDLHAEKARNRPIPSVRGELGSVV